MQAIAPWALPVVRKGALGSSPRIDQIRIKSTDPISVLPAGREEVPAQPVIDR